MHFKQCFEKVFNNMFSVWDIQGLIIFRYPLTISMTASASKKVVCSKLRFEKLYHIASHFIRVGDVNPMTSVTILFVSTPIRFIK